MFQFAGFPCYSYVLAVAYLSFAQTGCPIQKSAAHQIFAPSRSFSQLVTSFFGSQWLGILPMLFLFNQTLLPSPESIFKVLASTLSGRS